MDPYVLALPKGSDVDKASFLGENGRDSVNDGFSRELSYSSASIVTPNGELKYQITFTDCKKNWMSSIRLNNLEATFKSAKGKDVIKKFENLTVDHKNPTVEFILSKEELARLKAENPQGKVEVPCSISVRDTSGMRWRLTHRSDFFEKNEKSTLVILFDDGKKFYYLAHYSSYFDSLTCETLPKDDESDLPLVEVKDFKSKAFEEILYMVYPHKDGVTWKDVHVYEVIRLASFFSIETILQHCEEKLAADTTNSLAHPGDKLVISVEYKMPLLQNAVVDSIRSKKDIAEIQEHPLFQTLPKEVDLMIVNRMMEIVKTHPSVEKLPKDSVLMVMGRMLEIMKELEDEGKEDKEKDTVDVGKLGEKKEDAAEESSA